MFRFRTFACIVVFVFIFGDCETTGQGLIEEGLDMSDSQYIQQLEVRIDQLEKLLSGIIIEVAALARSGVIEQEDAERLYMGKPKATQSEGGNSGR